METDIREDTYLDYDPWEGFCGDVRDFVRIGLECGEIDQLEADADVELLESFHLDQIKGDWIQINNMLDCADAYITLLNMRERKQRKLESRRTGKA